MKKITTLKDLKDNLIELPDDLLDKFMVGYNYECESVTLLMYGDDEGEAISSYLDALEKYPALRVIGDYIDNIVEYSQKEEYTDEDSDKEVTSDKVF